MIDFTSRPLSDDVLAVEIRGDLTSEAAEYFFGCLEPLIEEGHTRIVVDCKDLRHISSLGLGMLLRAHARLKRVGGDVKLSGVESKLVSVLRLLHLDRVFSLYPSSGEALASFPPKAPAVQ